MTTVKGFSILGKTNLTKESGFGGGGVTSNGPYQSDFWSPIKMALLQRTLQTNHHTSIQQYTARVLNQQKSILLVLPNVGTRGSYRAKIYKTLGIRGLHSSIHPIICFGVHGLLTADATLSSHPSCHPCQPVPRISNTQLPFSPSFQAV